MKDDYYLVLYDSVEIAKNHQHGNTCFFGGWILDFRKRGVLNAVRFGFKNDPLLDVLFFVNTDGTDIKDGSDLFKRAT